MLRPYYWKSSNILLWFSYGNITEFDRSMEGEEIMLPVELKQFWVEMIHADTSKCKELDEVFSMLNRDNNPLGSDEGQAFIKTTGVRHTSMSVGDMIHDTDKDHWYVCLNSEWAKIHWIDRV